MAVGGWVVFLVSLVVGVLFYIFARLTLEKHFGRRRKLKSLDAQEKRVVGTLMLIAVGFFFAFVAGVLVVRSLLEFVSRHGFAPFAWWRIAVGLAGLAGLWAFG